MSNDTNTPTWVIDTTANSFEDDVFSQSSRLPVVVDFWAPWCAPCRQLGPLLEKLVREFAGRFVLVKANTDELPQIASQFQVQSIPSVFGVIGGEVVTYFAGALPERQVRDWIGELLRSGQVLEARNLEAHDLNAAVDRYREILQKSPQEAAAAIGLARSLMRLGHFDEAREVIAQLDKRGFLELEAEQLRAELELQACGTTDLEASRLAAETNPADLAARLNYAAALAGAQQYQQALEIALSLVAQGRDGIGESARQLMVNIFRVLPGDSELVQHYRRKLAILLF
ncbi:MAG: tetratricopeptide repeat protein [Pirellulaceae bacterium]|nr:tetratricopeptide repeat protein [Pirellulaceae bacterium]